MSRENPTWQDCAQSMNEALSPLDDARRACLRGTPVRTPDEIDEAVAMQAEVERVQSQVAWLRARFDDLAAVRQ